MPRALQTISGFFTAGGAGINVATPSAGDSFNVPSFSLSNEANIEQLSVNGATLDFIRVRSPRLHDANQGLRLQVGGTTRRSLLPWGMDETLYPSDTPIVELDATGAGTQGILMTYGFNDLPGVQPRLASWAEVQSRIVHVSGVQVALVSGAIGAWGNGVAINANFDNFEAGADYAVLGYTCSVAVTGIAITGKDTGNLKVGGPGANDNFETTNYFITASNETGRGWIPIIAANNKGSTIVQAVDVAAATATNVTFLMAQLA